MSILNDIHSYCKDSERHQAGTCAYLAFQPMTIFKPRGLASLWLHASKRAKKDYLGKSQVSRILHTGSTVTTSKYSEFLAGQQQEHTGMKC